MEYITIQQASEKWEIGIRRINTLCNGGRIEGAIKRENVADSGKNIKIC